MCGSGTFTIEAAGIINKQIPSIDRKFAFMIWPCFKEKSYSYLKKNSGEEKRAIKNFKIMASDIDANNIDITGKNVKASGFEEMITLKQGDFFQDIVSSSEKNKRLIVINPPYGTRIHSINIKEIYRKIGHTVRSQYQDCGYAIISLGLEMEKIMSLPYDRKIKFFNGGIKVAVIVKDNY